MKQYVLWETMYTNAGNVHPGKQTKQNWTIQTGITFEETNYGGNNIDARIIGIIDNIDSDKVSAFTESLSMFNMQTITAEEAVAHCNKCFPVNKEHLKKFPNGYFSLEDNTIVNNTPQGDI